MPVDPYSVQTPPFLPEDTAAQVSPQADPGEIERFRQMLSRTPTEIAKEKAYNYTHGINEKTGKKSILNAILNNIGEYAGAFSAGHNRQSYETPYQRILKQELENYKATSPLAQQEMRINESEKKRLDESKRWQETLAAKTKEHEDAMKVAGEKLDIQKLIANKNAGLIDAKTVEQELLNKYGTKDAAKLALRLKLTPEEQAGMEEGLFREGMIKQLPKAILGNGASGSAGAGSTTYTNRTGNQMMYNPATGRTENVPVNTSSVSRRVPNSAAGGEGLNKLQDVMDKFKLNFGTHTDGAVNALDSLKPTQTPVVPRVIKNVDGTKTISNTPPATPAKQDISFQAIKNGAATIPETKVAAQDAKLYPATAFGKNMMAADQAKTEAARASDNLLGNAIAAYANGTLDRAIGPLKGSSTIRALGGSLPKDMLDKASKVYDIRPSTETSNIATELSKLTQERIHTFSGSQTNKRDWDLVLQSIPRMTSNKEQFLKDTIRYNINQRIAQYMSAFPKQYNDSVDLKSRTDRVNDIQEAIYARILAGKDIPGKYFDPEYITGVKK